jgi:hypothetical protein
VIRLGRNKVKRENKTAPSLSSYLRKKEKKSRKKRKATTNKRGSEGLTQFIFSHKSLKKIFQFANIKNTSTQIPYLCLHVCICVCVWELGRKKSSKIGKQRKEKKSNSIQAKSIFSQVLSAFVISSVSKKSFPLTPGT